MRDICLAMNQLQLSCCDYITRKEGMTDWIIFDDGVLKRGYPGTEHDLPLNTDLGLSIDDYVARDWMCCFF